jgi:twitching motility two-component system response regulator PilG
MNDHDRLDLTLYDGIAAAHGGDYARATRLLNDVLAVRPDDEQAWFWLALSSPTPGDAIPRLRRVAELAPDREEVREALGLLLLADGLALVVSDPLSALATLLEASVLRPDDERVWLGLTQAATEDGDRLQYLSRVLAIVPDHAAARARMLSILARSSKQLAREGRREEARDLLVQATALAPDDVRIWLALAYVSDTPAAVIEALRRVVAIEPGHATATPVLANALVTQGAVEHGRGDLAAARAFGREAVALDPTHLKAWMLLAAVESGAEAAVCAENALEIDPLTAGAAEPVRAAIVEAGIAALRDGDERQARSQLSRAVQVDANNERAWVALSQVADTTEERLKALRRVVAINPEHTRAKSVLKALLLSEAAAAREADPGHARDYFREVLTLDPSSEDGWLGLASVETDSAALVQALEQAARANPANEETPARLAQLRAVAAPPPATQTAKATILVVDDSATIRASLALALKKEGYHVVAEPNGERALAAIENTRPDLIFLDIAMPQMDGYEVCRRLRKNPKMAGVPVIMLSGKDGFFDKVRGRMAGATEYITKPFDATALLAVVATHCGVAAGGSA